MPDPTFPYIISGQVFDDDLSTPRGNISLTMKNIRTAEIISTMTNSNGEFAFDCANFETYGYVNEDYVLVSTGSTGTNGNDLRIRIICRGYGQVEEIKAEYSIRT